MPDKKSFIAMSYNVAGLPSILQPGGRPSYRTKLISPKLNPYDLVSVQEDFAYHDLLIAQATHEYKTPTKGNVPIGDGCNFLSRMPLSEPVRVTWKDRYGVLPGDGADAWTLKGICYCQMEVAPGVIIDVYDCHADAGVDEGSLAARRSNMTQLGELIQELSAGKAVIVLADTNCRYTREPDNFVEAVLEPCGLTDPWVDIIRGGDRPQKGEEALIDHENPNGPTNEVVDKCWYRSGEGVQLEAVEYALLPTEFTDDNGDQLSDHYPITIVFEATIG